jgi:hypothetical protein
MFATFHVNNCIVFKLLCDQHHLLFFFKCLFKFIIAKSQNLIFVIVYWTFCLTLWSLYDNGPQLLIHTTLGYLMHIICQMIIYIVLFQNHMEALHLQHVVVLSYIYIWVENIVAFLLIVLIFQKKIDPPWFFRLHACSISISLNSSTDTNSYWMFFNGTCFFNFYFEIYINQRK